MERGGGSVRETFVISEENEAKSAKRDGNGRILGGIASFAILFFVWILKIGIWSSVETSYSSSDYPTYTWPDTSNPSGKYTPPLCKDSDEDMMTSILGFPVIGEKDETPCGNFYNYACADWLMMADMFYKGIPLSTFSLRSAEVDFEIRDIMESDIRAADPGPLKTAKSFYKDCLDQEGKRDSRGVAPLVSLIRETGGWPLMDGTTAPGRVSWNDVFKGLNGISDFDDKMGFFYNCGLFSVQIQTVAQEAKIVLFPPLSIYLRNDHLMMDKTLRFSRRREYVEYIKNVIYGLKSQDTRNYSSTIRKGANDIVDFELSLISEKEKYSILDESGDSGINSKSSSFTRVFTVQEFQSLLAQGKRDPGQINWRQLINGLNAPHGSVFKSTDKVRVISVEYFKNLAKLLDSGNKVTILNFLKWSVIYGLVPLTTSSMEELYNNFQDSVEKKDKPSRATACSNIVQGGDQGLYFPLLFAVGAEYVRKKISAKTREVAFDILTYIRDEYLFKIQTSTWINPESRVALEHQLSSMRVMMGYPDWILNSTELTAYYDGLGELKSGQFFENHLKLVKFQTMSASSKLPQHRSSDPEMTLPVLAVSPSYMPHYNLLNVPAGVLDEPFFQQSISAANFGSFGFFLSHELGHAIYVGFDKRSLLPQEKKLWTGQSLSEIDKKLDCLRFQYRDLNTCYSDDTLGEDMADNSGLPIAYSAYKNWTKTNLESDPTDDKSFFLANGQNMCSTSDAGKKALAASNDNHSKGSFRIIGTLQNNVDFARAWNCPAGSNMNRNQKCEFW